MLQFPHIDPVIISFGPLAIRWYAMAYIAGILLGLWRIKSLNERHGLIKDLKPFDELMTWSILGIILGGRIGYVLFYNLSYYLTHPIEILMIWNGGMAFHGGLVGVAISLYFLCKKNNYSPLQLADLAAIAAPIGLFFGRIANFINGELYGRPTDVAWGMVFPQADHIARHPSQIYQAFCEGIILFLLLNYLYRFEAIRKRTGLTAAIFLIAYGIVRALMEFFREPDSHIGLALGPFSRGQLLSIPLFLAGFSLMFFCLKKAKKSENRT